MIILNSITTYPFLTILTNIGKRSFENMGRLVKKSGDTIGRILRPGAESIDEQLNIRFSSSFDIFMLQHIIN